MKNKLKYSLLILLFLLSNLSASVGDESEFQTFHFDKSAVIIVKSISHNNKHFIKGRYGSFLPLDYDFGWKSLDKFNFNDSGVCILNIKITKPENFLFRIDENVEFTIFLIPGDTLHMSINLNDSSKIMESINFTGRYSSIYEFHIRRQMKIGIDFDEKAGEILRANLPVPDMQRKLDSIGTIETNFIAEYTKSYTLPGWYLIYLKSNITYIKAMAKLNYLSYRRGMLNIKEVEPNNYYEFLNDVKINNEDAVLSYYYYLFIDQYISMLLRNEFSGMDRSEQNKLIGLRCLHLADSLLTGEVKSIYKIFIISFKIIGIGQYELAEKIITEQNNEMAPKYISYLEGYLRDRMTLKDGDKAPGFYLPDPNNEYKSLADYRGKVVLLNFWFPGCKPCIMEIPYEQKLVEEFKGKDFELINICVSNPEEEWHKAIKEFGVKGINLYVNKNWHDKLTESYKLSGFPHYTLIDKNGNIISNFPKRPREGISEDIKNLLLDEK